jgi:hypothetical protein
MLATRTARAARRTTLGAAGLCHVGEGAASAVGDGPAPEVTGMGRLGGGGGGGRGGVGGAGGWGHRREEWGGATSPQRVEGPGGMG